MKKLALAKALAALDPVERKEVMAFASALSSTAVAPAAKVKKTRKRRAKAAMVYEAQAEDGE